MLGLMKGNLKDTQSTTDPWGSYPAFSRREMLSRPGTSGTRRIYVLLVTSQLSVQWVWCWCLHMDMDEPSLLDSLWHQQGQVSIALSILYGFLRYRIPHLAREGYVTCPLGAAIHVLGLRLMESKQRKITWKQGWTNWFTLLTSFWNTDSSLQGIKIIIMGPVGKKRPENPRFASPSSIECVQKGRKETWM